MNFIPKSWVISDGYQLNAYGWYANSGDTGCGPSNINVTGSDGIVLDSTKAPSNQWMVDNVYANNQALWVLKKKPGKKTSFFKLELTPPL
jgi:hypothetical protein